ARVPRFGDRQLYPGHGRRVLQARRRLAALGDRGEELRDLDHREIVVSETDAPAGVELAVEGMGGPAQLGRPALVHRRTVDWPVVAELVHPLEAPGDGAVPAVHLERQIAVRTGDDPTGLERALRAVREADERADVVLVRHRPARVIGRGRVVVRATGV